MNPQLEKTVYTVTELTQSIKSLLELQYRFVHIQGEVSNLRIPYSGHMYFTLKDQHSQMRAVLFKQQQRYLQAELKEGQSVICHGRISVYEPRGEYQIIVDTVDFAGSGNLQIEFEKLKNRLKTEGLFEPGSKKEIPSFPDKIAVITSPTGAAIHDFLKISSKRNYWGSISILPVTVQGKNSSTEIAEAIQWACSSLDVELLVLIRGGGSIEDLWSFNEEKTARAIHEATIPIVTGVGHDTDYTIADMCADLHTHTPTAAAEAILPDRYTLLQAIEDYRMSLSQRIEKYIFQREQDVKNLVRIMGDMELFIVNNSLKLDYQLSTMINGFRQFLIHASTHLTTARDKLLHQSPMHKISVNTEKLVHREKEMTSAMYRLMEKKGGQFGTLAALLDSASPLSVLSRGYSVITKISRNGRSGEVVSQSSQTEIGERVNVRLHRGELQCRIEDKTKE